jgi:four helix bundle protein
VEIRSANDLIVYQRAYKLAMDIFKISSSWPAEERYALTGQVRRCSRSVCGNLKEGWSKRRYELHFISKLTDADGENSETETWLDFARDCGYLSEDDHRRLSTDSREVGQMLGSMLMNPSPFIIRT